MDTLGKTLADLQRNAEIARAALTASEIEAALPAPEPDCACRGIRFLWDERRGQSVACPRCNIPPYPVRARLTFDSPIPPAMSFDSWEMRDDYGDALPVARYIENWCELAQGWLLLYGPPGTGKTHLAVAAARRLAERMPVHFTTATDLLDALRFAFSADADGAEHYRMMDRLKSVGCLVIDDLGKERPTPFGVERLGAIMHWRHAARSPTLVTTNLDVPELDRLDRAISSRLQDVGLPVIQLPIVAPDYRRRGPA